MPLPSHANRHHASYIIYGNALAGREVGKLTTPQLYTLARSLRRQIEQATGPVRFTTPVAEIPGDEYHDQVQDWSG